MAIFKWFGVSQANSQKKDTLRKTKKYNRYRGEKGQIRAAYQMLFLCVPDVCGHFSTRIRNKLTVHFFLDGFFLGDLLGIILAGADLVTSVLAFGTLGGTGCLGFFLCS